MKKISVFLISLIISVSSIAVVGCEDNDLILRQTDFNIVVGEYLDFAQYVDGNFAISVDDTSVVTTMCGTVVKGTKEGVVNVSVSKGLKVETAKVNVSYEKPQLTLTCDSSLYTTVRGSIITFKAQLNASANPQTQIFWSVNGGETINVGEKYELTLSDFGKYEVTARAGDCRQTLTAVCYSGFRSEPTLYSQKLTTSVGEQIELTLDVNDKFTNPTPQIEWKVNGVTVSSGESETYLFKPTEVGKFTVCATANGIKAINELTVVVTGKAQITNAYCDFDCYPQVKLRWNGVSDAMYRITMADGSVFFTEACEFFIDEYIDAATPQTVKIKCLSGDYYEESDEVGVVTPQLSSEQIKYLNKQYFDGNYYLTSDEEVYELVSYAVFFRPNIGQSDDAKTSKLTAYMGYDSEFSAAILLSEGWSLTEQTGSYSFRASGDTKKGGIITLSITFHSAREPEAFDFSYKTASQSLVTPAFGGGYTVLQSEEGVSVSTTDELYYVVQKGYLPKPKGGSAAQRIYAAAASVIADIISIDMTDEQKVRAVYDWIMWQTTYDYEATSVTAVSEAVKQPAYYMEGVFDYGFAVCDGIAKSVSLLCNLVGVPCMRVVGTADNGTVSRHAWNKVCVDGVWYNVDATWGDSRITVGNDTYEAGMHSYFLKSDDEMISHEATYPQQYPKAEQSYDWYGVKREYSMGEASMSVTDASIDKLSAAIKCGAENAVFTVTIGEETIERDFYCIEIQLSEKAKKTFKNNSSYVNFAIRDCALTTLSVSSWLIVGNYLLIIIR